MQTDICLLIILEKCYLNCVAIFFFTYFVTDAIWKGAEATCAPTTQQNQKFSVQYNAEISLTNVPN